MVDIQGLSLGSGLTICRNSFRQSDHR